MPDDPRARKVTVFLTDVEWRGVKIAAAAHDTSIQGYVTTALLRTLQGDDREALNAAGQVSGKRPARARK